MRMFFVVFFLVLLVTAPAIAFESGDAANFQAQAQNLAGADYGLAGAESKYVGGQVDIGGSSTLGA